MKQTTKPILASIVAFLLLLSVPMLASAQVATNASNITNKATSSVRSTLGIEAVALIAIALLAMAVIFYSLSKRKKPPEQAKK